MVIRSQSNECVLPPGPGTGPRRRKISSNALGQSSSVPSSNPIRWRSSLMRCSGVSSAESRQVVGDLSAPRRPVVRYVVTPQVELVLDTLGRQQPGELPGAFQRAGGVFPLTLAAHKQHAHVVTQPGEMFTVHVPHVVERIVEVRRAASLTPAMP